jgi:peptide/nickel transport system permease protein
MAIEVDTTETATETAAFTSDQVSIYGQTSNPFAKLWYYIRRYPIIPVIILALLLIAALIGPYVAPFPRDKGFSHDRNLGLWERSRAAYIPLGGTTIEELSYRSCDVIDPDGGPASENIDQCGKLHILGADHTGRDIFSRLLHGSRISIAVVTFSLTSGMILGTAVALFSGYYGGILDEIVTRFVDVWNALPFLMVAIVITQLFGAKVIILAWKVDMLLFVLMLVAWVGFVRVIRAQVFVLRELDYVAAARVAGASDIRIIWRHLVPGVMNTVIVVASLNTSGLILAESTLSFVGAGIQPPTPAWGVMTNEGRDYILEAPHLTLVPGFAIFLVVLSMNFFGDWLRDRLDPRLRQIA